MFPSYRNQSINLHCKSIDWFLYEGNIGMKKVKIPLWREIDNVTSYFWIFTIRVTSTLG